MTHPGPEIFDHAGFAARLAVTDKPIPVFREALKESNQRLRKEFETGVSPGALVQQHAWLIDQLLMQAWRQFVTPQMEDQVALVAVGGYGRGELLPRSDIDIMILLADEQDPALCAALERFLTMLWDIGLEVGHSVRTIAECEAQALSDITVATNLMEARLLHGSRALFDTMRRRTGPDSIWPGDEFFAAKLQEQVTRHHKFHDTAYNLEPNIKEGPGGLRDIQVIGWVAKRHFGADTLHDLVAHHFLTAAEYQMLHDGQEFLWRIRIALHNITGRREDRLLFDHQRTLARMFGYTDHDHRLAVEHFMMDYYRNIMELSRLNEMLLQLFKEEILYAATSDEAKPINARFQIRKGFLEAARADIFATTPSALLEIFLILCQNPQIKGVRAGTIRQIRNHCYLIDAAFRADRANQQLFIEILRQPVGVTHELRRMHRYGVLAAYLPVFNRIVGQMQHDLFHVYTVDEHILRALRNVRRFSVPEYTHEFPLCSSRFHYLKKPELLYIAAIFHDIAKGRGGDHSVLGEVTAREFCEQHGLGSEDTDLVRWLVRHHLLMSVTAQSNDLSDTKVINQFATEIKTVERLDYLYLLTVADIRATSPAVWNSWKDALLKELYHAASRALKRGLDNPLEQIERLQHNQQMAHEELRLHRIGKEQAEAVWSRLNEEYFLVHSSDEIAWQTRHIVTAKPEQLPLVVIRQMTRRGGSEIFIYTRDRDYLFARVTAALGQLDLNIVEARIITSADGFVLDTFIVLDSEGEPISDQRALREIEHCVKKFLAMDASQPPRIVKHVSRALKHFPIPTQVSFQDDNISRHTVMKVTTSDRPGLLARIGAALWECHVKLQKAKIGTFGERVEDTFFITGQDNKKLVDAEQLRRLEQAIIRQLDQ